MAEQPRIPRSDDRLVNLEDAGERAYWCKFYGVGLDRLIEAVKVAGPTAQDVRTFLEKRGGAATR
jgi:hypothetical protein